jgi:ATP-binding cassette, subfamily B, bacterial
MNEYLKHLWVSFHHFRRALSFVWESSHKWTVANISLVALQGLLPLATLLLIKLLVDTIAYEISQSESSISMNSLFYLILAMGGVAFFNNACGTLSTLAIRIQDQIVTDHMHDILHAKSIEVDLDYYENSEYYDTMHRAQEEAPYQPMTILKSLLQIGQNGVSLMAMAGLLWWLHWAVIPVLLLTALPDFLVRMKFSNTLYAWQRERTPVDRKTWYLNWMLTRDTHAKEIRIFNIGQPFRSMFSNLRILLRHELQDIEKRRAFSLIAAQTIGVLGVFGVYYFLANRTLQGILSLGDLVMYFQAIQRGAGYLQGLGGSLSTLYESSLFLKNVEEFLNIQPKITNPSHPQTFPHPIKQGLVFDHVTFSYRDQENVALDDLTFSIRPGEHIAFVGENGAGKTTLVKLLCRLYDPTHGKITLDGIDIRNYSTSEYRNNISVIFQDFARYFLTATENIALGESENPDILTVIEAAKQAGIDERLARLPQGYQTILGKWFDGGQELSIGEWQKVAIARAFYRNSEILVLDEPTSAMDALAEAELFERFLKLARNRMAILISHRLSTVKMVDRIYVLEQGKIVESGSHQDLVQRQGEYAKLYETQARYYK